MPPRAKLNLTSQHPAANDPPPSGGSGQGETRPDREGKKIIAGHFPKSTWAELRRLCVDQERTTQVLLEEALADLFAKYRNRS
jgi:hypothetical protein